jgi:hypothetical protein
LHCLLGGGPALALRPPILDILPDIYPEDTSRID